MFAWLRRLLSAKDSSGYTAAEREIFEYWDGRRKRVADPLAVHRTLLTDPDLDMKIHPAMTALPTVDGLRATGKVAAAVRRAFGIGTLEAGGLTDGECLALFCEFGAYIHALTESNRPLPSSPVPTASAVPQGADSLTRSSADSGSIVQEPLATPTAP
jgi:hypothetical protein